MLNTSLSLPCPAGMNHTTDRDGFATHSFPPDGLVAQARIAYESTPLLTAQIRSGVFVFAGAGGNLTAIAGSPGATIVDTGYGARVAELEDAIAGVLELRNAGTITR